MSKESGKSFSLGLAVPCSVTYTKDGPQVDPLVIATDSEMGERAAAGLTAHLSQPGVMERTLSGSSRTSHAMPGSRWSSTAWQPTGPNLEWQRRLREKRGNQGDPTNS